jgi:hypothetical protein
MKKKIGTEIMRNMYSCLQEELESHADRMVAENVKGFQT